MGGEGQGGKPDDADEEDVTSCTQVVVPVFIPLTSERHSLKGSPVLTRNIVFSLLTPTVSYLTFMLICTFKKNITS